MATPVTLGIDIGGTNITSTAAELNLLDNRFGVVNDILR